MEAAAAAAETAADAAVIEHLERQHMETVQERDTLREQVATAQSALAALQAETTEQAATAQSLLNIQNEVALEKQKTKAALDQFQNAEERMDRMRAETDTLREEIRRLGNENASLQKEVTSAKSQAQLKESDVIPLFHEKERLQRELDSFQAHSNFLQQECEAKQRDYQHLQKQARDRTLQLELQLDHNNNELEKANTQKSALESTEIQLQAKLNDVTLTNQALKSEKQQLETSIAMDRQEHSRITALNEERLLRYQKRLEDVERDNTNLRKTAEKALRAGDQEMTETRQALVAKYEALLSDQARQFEEKLKAVQPTDGRLLKSPARMQDIEHEDDDDDGGPIGVMELVQQRNAARTALAAETVRRKKAELAYKRLHQEIEKRVPEFAQQKEEFELAVQSVETLRSRLKATLRELKDSRAEEKESRQSLGEMERKLDFRTRESQGLAKQVQQLLISRSSGANSNTDIPVTVEEVQTQNMQLLSENRRLTQTITDMESSVETSQLKKGLEDARQEVRSLQKDREKQQAAITKIVQQRDLYRSLLNTHDSNLLGSEDSTAVTVAQKQTERANDLKQRVLDLESKISHLQSTADNASRDKENAEERLKRYEVAYGEMSQSNNNLQRELLSAKGDAARATTETTFYQEKCTRLEESNERMRSQSAEEKSSRMEYQRINTELQNSVLSATAERNSVESKHRQLEAKVRLLEAQVSEARATLSRKVEENALLAADNTRQGAMIESIRRIETNLSAKDSSEKEHLQKELQVATEKVNENETKYMAKVEKLTHEIGDLKGTTAELERSGHAHQTASLKAQKELLECKAELQTLKTNCTRLETQLRSAKRKLGEDGDAEDVEITLQTRIDELELQLSESKKAVDMLETQVNDARSAAQTSEQELASIQKTTEGFKADLLKEKETLLARLESSSKESQARQDMIKALTNDLAGHRGERNKMEEDLRSQIVSLEAQIRGNQDVVDTAKASVASLNQEIEKYRGESASAQRNYERELAVHAEARASLRQIQDSLEEERREKTSVEEKLASVQSSLAESESVFDAEKGTLVKQLEEMEKRTDAQREENKTLQKQLQDISSKMTSTELTEGVDHEDAEKKRLQHVVLFLREEIKTIQTQLESANRATKREQATVESLRRSLDSARSELNTGGTSNSNDEESTLSDVKQKLAASEEQLTLLKDSNKLLREENGKLDGKLTLQSKELADALKSAQPVDDVRRELGDKITRLETERSSLLRELESWKERMTSFLDNVNEVDPEEHKRLLKEYAELKKEKDSQESRLTKMRQFLQKDKQKINDLTIAAGRDKEEIGKLEKENAALKQDSSTKSQVKELKAKIQAMEKEKIELQASATGAEQRGDSLRETLRTLKQQVSGLQDKEKELLAQLNQEKRRADSLEKSKSTVAVAAGQQKSPETAQAVGGGDSLSTVTIPKVPEDGFRFGPTVPHKPAPRAAATAFVPKRKESSPKPELPKVTATPSTKEEDKAAGKKRTAESAMIDKTEMDNEIQKKKKKLLEKIKKVKEEELAVKDTQREATTDQAEAAIDTTSKNTEADMTTKKVQKQKESSIPVVAEDTQKKDDDVDAESQAEPKESEPDASSEPSVEGQTYIVAEKPPKEKVVSKETSTGGAFLNIIPPGSGSGKPSEQKFVAKGTSTGGAFLNMKAPGSGNDAPSFPSGSSITLPSASFQTISPFGAFGESSSFGPAGATAAKPPFGSSTQTIPEESAEKKEEGENVDEEMEAED